MLDKLFLKYLNPKGKIYYWVGQVILIIALLVYLVFFRHQSLRDDDTFFVFVLCAILMVLGWGGFCLLFWHKNKQPKNKKNSIENNNIVSK